MDAYTRQGLLSSIDILLDCRMFYGKLMYSLEKGVYKELPISVCPSWHPGWSRDF